MGRAIVVNISQLASYSQIKMLCATKMHMGDGPALYFCASMLSGFITSFTSMPFDVAKTRVQSVKTTIKPPGLLSMMRLILKNEGITALWKGFWPTYCRIGPHTVLTLSFNDEITKLYKHYAT